MKAGFTRGMALAAAMTLLGATAQAQAPTKAPAQTPPPAKAPAQPQPAAPAQAADDLAAAAKKAGNLTKFMAAVGSAGLEAALNKGKATIFAPSDAAFDKLPKALVDSLMKPEGKAQLTRLLEYHVVPGTYSAERLGKAKAKNFALRTSEGATFEVDTSKGVTINGAPVAKADIKSGGNVIHVIDQVIVPPKLRATVAKFTAATAKPAVASPAPAKPAAATPAPPSSATKPAATTPAAKPGTSAPAQPSGAATGPGPAWTPPTTQGTSAGQTQPKTDAQKADPAKAAPAAPPAVPNKK